MPTTDGRCPVSIDGAEYFRSRSIRCRRCSRRKLRSDWAENFHRTVCARLVEPGSPVVPPFMPELAPESNGGERSDCECNAAERLLREPGTGFIVGARRGDH